MADVYPTNLVDWMRRNGVASVTLSGDAITSLSLGASPIPDDADEPTQQKLSPQEQERQERDRRRALALRSSGGALRRLSGEDDIR